MEVLVKNPFAQEINPADVSTSFWSSDCLYMGSRFSFSSLFGQTDPLSYSPFLVLDARIAFIISQAEKTDAYCRGLGALGTIGVTVQTRSCVGHNEDKDKFQNYVKEYLPDDPSKNWQGYNQIITFGENRVDPALWNRLKVGGFYLMGAEAPLSIQPGSSFEAFGKLWPVGEATEFGWLFQEEKWGLKNFEFAKIKKLTV